MSIEKIADQLPEGLLRFNPDSGLEYANRHAQEVFQLPAEYRGKTLSGASRCEEAARHIEDCLARVFQENRASYCVFSITLGERRVFALRLYPEAAVGHKTQAANGLFFDITGIRKHEEEILLARDQAEHKERMRQDFLSNLSHEIRNPLNAITGFAQFLKADDISLKERYKNLDLIEENSRRLLRIVDTILDVSRVDRDEMEILTEEVYVNTVLEEVYRNNLPLREKLDKKDLPFVYLAPETDLSAVIYCDRFRLHQILDHLVNNALKFTPAGHVQFGYEKKDDTYLFYVTDTGIGIPGESLKTVFDRFYQQDSSYVKKYGGSGLGLSLSKKLAELMGGTLHLESQAGEGTTAYLELPAGNKQQVNAERTKDVIKEDYDWSGALILVVDDMKEASRYLATVIRRFRGEPLIADSGTMAEEMIRKYPEINLVLMDIQMPGQDGITTAENIRKERPGLAIIAQTAYALKGDREVFLAKDLNDYITKPVLIPLLCQKIDRYLSENKSSQGM